MKYRLHFTSWNIGYRVVRPIQLFNYSVNRFESNQNIFLTIIFFWIIRGLLDLNINRVSFVLKMGRFVCELSEKIFKNFCITLITYWSLSFKYELKIFVPKLWVEILSCVFRNFRTQTTCIFIGWVCIGQFKIACLQETIIATKPEEGVCILKKNQAIALLAQYYHHLCRKYN